MKAIHLRCEYLHNPIGIDIAKPRLFWNCAEGITQSAYQIIAKNEQGEIVWDSGKVAGDTMSHISYGGSALKSRDQITWQVCLWDEKDNPGEWSEEATFEMGLLEPEDWQAFWIAGDYQVKKKERYPVDCFCKTFETKGEPSCVKARLYITACGLYEAQMNGKRVGDYILAPGITDYRKRIQYQVYDVLPLISNGKNQLEIQLADGWYRGSVGAWGMKCYYGTQTKVLAQLEITKEDGSVEIIGTDDTFAWSNDGAIRFADNKDGEIVDAVRQPSYSGKAKTTICHVQPTAANNVAITEHERFTPAEITTPAGKRVMNFGQNMAGYVEFHVHARAGQKIFLRFGEMLDENGEFTQKNIQCSNRKVTSPLQQVEYICKEGENRYKTRFAIFGFQYVLVESDVDMKPEDMTAIAVYSDMEQCTTFDSSNELLNKLVESTLWSARNNSADLPTDCPTRERHGWTGDAQIFFNTAAYLMDYATFARKFQKDMTDWQTPDGCFPQIAPEGGTDPYMRTMNGSVGWADAGVMIPYRFWKLYGDRQILEDNYEAMKKYAGFMINRCGRKGFLAPKLGLTGEAKKYVVNTGQSYGEWAEPADVHPNHWTDVVAPHPEVSTAYTSYVMCLMTEIATELDHMEDAKKYREYAEKTKMAYQQLVETPAFSLNTDRQALLVRPLALHLLNEKQTEFAKNRLIQAMENYNWRIGTGFLSTPFILDVLEDIDLQAAYRLLENEEMPGWLFMPKAGANTIWESWEGTRAQGGIASLNHYSKGACCEWLFREMCGIHVDGKNHFTIAPKPGGTFTYAATQYRSVYGRVGCQWERTQGGWKYNITVPANTTADIVLPDGRTMTVTAGIYEW